jgi:hypothetical protein
MPDRPTGPLAVTILLAPGTTCDEVARAATLAGWSYHGLPLAVPDDPTFEFEVGLPKLHAYRTGALGEVSYFESDADQPSYLVVEGAGTAEAIAQARRLLPCVAPESLLPMWESAPGPELKGWLLGAAGVLNDEARSVVFVLLRDGFYDPDPAIRHQAWRNAELTAWPEWRLIVQDVTAVYARPPSWQPGS